jgi:hypothetical protein
MVLNLGSMNWLAVLVAAVVGFIIGIVYYARPVMGQRWAASAGVELGSGSPPVTTVVVSALTVLLTAVALGVLISATGAVTVGDGAALGLICWLGFVLTWRLSGALFEHRPLRAVGINLLQELIAMVVMGAIIGVWH